MRQRKKIEAYKSEWLESDVKYYSEAELKKALDRMKSLHAWPPNISEFLALCEYASEYENAEDAYARACKTPLRDLDVLTQATVVEVGQFELKTMSSEKMKPIFVKKYREIAMKKRRGEDLKVVIGESVPQIAPIPATPESGRRWLAGMSEMLRDAR